jgi:hypothetical protein
MYVATKKDEDNAADGRFSTASIDLNFFCDGSVLLATALFLMPKISGAYLCPI